MSNSDNSRAAPPFIAHASIIAADAIAACCVDLACRVTIGDKNGDTDRGASLHTIETNCARLVLGTLGLAALVAVRAQAHDGTGLAGGFAAGLWHPISGLDHLLAMVSVGLWGAFLGRPLIYVLPMVFPGMMVVGAAIGMNGIELPQTEVGIAASVITLGVMILFAVRAPIAVACAVVGLFALFHGYAHGAELPSAADPIGYRRSRAARLCAAGSLATRGRFRSPVPEHGHRHRSGLLAGIAVADWRGCR